MSNGKYVEEKLYFHYLFGHDSAVSELFYNFIFHVYFVYNFLLFLIVLINNSLKQGSDTSTGFH